MARYRMRLRTDWPATETFAYLGDPSNLSDWDPGVSSSTQQVSDGPGVGAAYDVEVSGQVWRYVVDAYEAPHRIRMHASQRWITSVDTISVSADGTGSIATYDADLRLHGVLRVGDPILAVVFRRIGDRAAEGLRQRLQGERIA